MKINAPLNIQQKDRWIGIKDDIRISYNKKMVEKLEIVKISSWTFFPDTHAFANILRDYIN